MQLKYITVAFFICMLSSVATAQTDVLFHEVSADKILAGGFWNGYLLNSSSIPYYTLSVLVHKADTVLSGKFLLASSSESYPFRDSGAIHGYIVRDSAFLLFQSASGKLNYSVKGKCQSYEEHRRYVHNRAIGDTVLHNVTFTGFFEAKSARLTIGLIILKYFPSNEKATDN